MAHADPTGSTSPLPLIGQLLAHAATGAPLSRCGRRFAWRPAGSDQRQFQWALDGGLGPLLHRATGDCASVIPPAWSDALLSADLTARVRHGNAVDTTMEIIGTCNALQVRMTLLKGISVSELYPAEHLRPMADIDLLISEHAYALVEGALLQRGYRKIDFPVIETLHHGAPLRHPTRHTVVELHTALFPDNSPFSEGRVFSLPSLDTHSTRSQFHGVPVTRLAPELQLVYLASSWVNDLTLSRIHPSFLASLFDGIYLLGIPGRSFDWMGMLEWLDNDFAEASLLALLTYLPKFGVKPLPAKLLARLASGQRLVGPVQLTMMHAALDRHLIGGKPWTSVLPPPVPGRYSPSFQFRKRVADRWFR